MQGLERYDRQIRLPGFGALAQQKLRNANVLVVGAGGLGCPVLQYLVAAGVGHIGIADEDIVTLSNLQRQVLYNEGNVGSNKAVVAAQKLSAYNSTIRITPIENRLMPSNCTAIVEPYELIVDCTDNFATRYLLADASVLLDKIVVYGAVSRYEGQVAVFNALSDGKRSAGYRDLFPLPPEPGEVQDCSEAGVLGVLPGIIGAMQAAEVIKLITGIGETLINQLLTYSLLDHQSYIVRFSANDKSRQFMPRSLQELALFDYGESCSFSQTAKVLDAILFDRILGNPLIQIIDCREEGELPLVTDFDHIQMPVSKIDIQDIRFAHGEHVFFCQSGKRSKSVADRLSNRYGDPVRFSTLDEGILSWIQYKQSFKHPIHEE